MTRLIDLTCKILMKHTDPDTRASELIVLGWCDNEAASEHISRYVFASKLVRGVVLDVASGTCYGSSILRRSGQVKSVVSVDLDKDALKYGKVVYGVDCVLADATHLPFRRCFDSVVSIETLEHIKDQEAFLENIKLVLKEREGGSS